MAGIYWIRAACCGGRRTEEKGARRRARAREGEQLRTAARGEAAHMPTELRTMAHCTATIRPSNRLPKRLNCTSRRRPSESSPEAVGAVGRTARPRWSSCMPAWAELHARGQSQPGSLPSRAAAVSHRTRGRRGGADGGTHAWGIHGSSGYRRGGGRIRRSQASTATGGAGGK